MEGFLGGRTLRAVEKLGPAKDTKELAIRFLVYGALAEVLVHTGEVHRFPHRSPSQRPVANITDHHSPWDRRTCWTAAILPSEAIEATAKFWQRA